MGVKLTEWIQKINESNIPIFKSTVNSITVLTSQDDSSSSELASIILRDPSLAARILKFANSSYYNPSHTPTNTISRAVIVLGFNVVRDLSLSLAIIESLLKSHSRSIVNTLMAKSFHAATQARNLAKINGESELEEIFIAALLYNLGEMTFWCIADDYTADKLAKAMSKPDCKPEKAQRKVLGFRFSTLTGELVREWNLNKLLAINFINKDYKEPRLKFIHLGIELAETIPEFGWESDNTNKVCEKIANQLDLSLASAKKIVMDGARMAAKVASSYGAFSIANLIPGYDEEMQLEEEPDFSPTVKYPEPDPLLQLKILRELSSLLKNGYHLNLIIETILEGIHRGIGMDRAVFALYIPLKTHLRAKFAVGIDTNSLLNNFYFNVDTATKNPFSEVLQGQHNGLWIKSHMTKEYFDQTRYQINNILGTKNFFIAPVIVNERPVGLFYGDRQPSSRPLDKISFESFEHFSHQASLTLDYLSRKK